MPWRTRLLEDAVSSKGAVGWDKKTKRGGSSLCMCCCAVCCPCMTYGATLKELPPNKFMCGGNYLGACLTYTFCFWLTLGTGAGCLECCLRQGVSDLEREDEGYCCSFLYAFCCAPCSSIQMFKQARLMAAENDAGDSDQANTAASAQSSVTFGRVKNRKPASGSQCIAPQDDDDGAPASRQATWAVGPQLAVMEL